jgi:hypothetical protein
MRKKQDYGAKFTNISKEKLENKYADGALTLKVHVKYGDHSKGRAPPLK